MDEEITPMSDEEAPLFRFLRYGQLPERIVPADMVETVPAEPAREEPVPPVNPHWTVYG